MNIHQLLKSTISNINTSCKGTFLNYIKALLLVKGKKNCKSMGREIQGSYDKLYNFLTKALLCLPHLKNLNLTIANFLAKRSKISFLIVD